MESSFHFYRFHALALIVIDNCPWYTVIPAGIAGIQNTGM